MAYDEDYDDIMAKSTLCKKCGCRLINWTWKEHICQLCFDKRNRKNYDKRYKRSEIQ
jgi:hypothetical protein